MSIRDRGTKKWTSLMLPEHVKQLRDFFEDEYYKVDKPVLDEQQLEEMNEKIQEAMEYQSLLKFTYYKNGHMKELKGYIHNAHPTEKTLYIVNKEMERIKLRIEDIVQLESIEDN